MADETEGLDASIVEAFNGLDADSEVAIPLTKRDIELLINTISELHQSYALLIEWPFLVHSLDKEIEAQTTEHAKRSYSAFAELSNGLMRRFITSAGGLP